MLSYYNFVNVFFCQWEAAQFLFKKHSAGDLFDMQGNHKPLNHGRERLTQKREQMGKNTLSWKLVYITEINKLAS